MKPLKLVLLLTVAGPPSSCRPPWLDTMIPWTPCSTASSASSLVRIPLMIMGRRVRDCSQCMSFQLMDGSNMLDGTPYSSSSAVSCMRKHSGLTINITPTQEHQNHNKNINKQKWSYTENICVKTKCVRKVALGCIYMYLKHAIKVLHFQVRGELKLIANVIPTFTSVWHVDCEYQGLVTECLHSVHELLR